GRGTQELADLRPRCPETQAEIAINLGHMQKEAFARLRGRTSEIGCMLGGLITKLSRPEAEVHD
ncbi:MAG: hypothetical protein ACUVXJ_01200, partial [Phycisphaerae bacterium]